MREPVRRRAEPRQQQAVLFKSQLNTLLYLSWQSISTQCAEAGRRMCLYLHGTVSIWQRQQQRKHGILEQVAGGSSQKLDACDGMST